jgi:hypothetical protein
VRSIALIHHLLKGRGILVIPGAAPDRTLDVVFGHVGGTGAVDGQTQSEIGVDVTPAFAGGDGDLSRQTREHVAALCIVGGLLALDRRPLGMSRHGFTFAGDAGGGAPGIWPR